MGLTERERGTLKDNIFVSFSKFPDLTAEKYLNGLNMILNDWNSWIA